MSASLGRRFWILLLAMTVARLVLAGSVGLSTDESHYAMYARRLAWGYFDHPPMVAFLAATSRWWGETPFGWRFGAVLCWSGALVFLAALLRRMYANERVVWRTALLLCVIPVHGLLSIALLPDATLNLFWCATMYLGWRAVTERKSQVWWIATGLAIGGSLLSKYHGVVLGMALAGFLLFTRHGRSRMLSPWPYLAACIALVVFSPNVVWNLKHDWISYAFQLSHGGGSGHPDLGKLANSIGGQLGAGSPILFCALVISFISLFRRGEAGPGQPSEERLADLYLLWMGALPFVFFCGMGFIGKILPHWPAVGWWGGAALLATVWDRRERAGGVLAVRWRRWLHAGIALSTLLIGVAYVSMFLPVSAWAHELADGVLRRLPGDHGLPAFAPEYDLSSDLHGWEEGARSLEALRRTMPRPERTFLCTHHFLTTSQLALFLDRETVATSVRDRQSQYRIWVPAEELVGWDALFVDDNHDFVGPERYGALFEKVDHDRVVVEPRRFGRPTHIFHVYRCYGFRGSYDPDLEPGALANEHRPISSP